MEPQIKVALVDTASGLNLSSSNPGLTFVQRKLNADIYRWDELLEGEYELVAFNIFYSFNVLNVVPFLRNNGIEPLNGKRKGGPRVIAGGQGISNSAGILDEIVDWVFRGELDGDYLDERGWCRASKLTSTPINGQYTSVIETTRGCKYRCGFCEYGHVQGGPYRERPLGEVKEQINQLRLRGSNRANFFSANLAGYGDVRKLIDYCESVGFWITNNEFCLRDFDRLGGWLPQAVRFGLESFHEDTRRRIGKSISDQWFEDFMLGLMSGSRSIRIYLIYGLPGDDYGRWFDWVRRLGEMRRQAGKNILLNFAVSTFEPRRGTPLEGDSTIDFDERNEFLKEWAAVLYEQGFIGKNPAAPGFNIREVTRGQVGAGEYRHRVCMEIIQGGPELTDKLIYAIPRGINWSLSKREAAKFLEGKFRRKDVEPGFLRTQGKTPQLFSTERMR